MLTCKCLNIVINNISSDIEKIDSINFSDTEKNELFFQQVFIFNQHNHLYLHIIQITCQS